MDRTCQVVVLWACFFKKKFFSLCLPLLHSAHVYEIFWHCSRFSCNKNING
ncbi:hypothetical protein PO909_025244 [Leuciscus waleckii]